MSCESACWKSPGSTPCWPHTLPPGSSETDESGLTRTTGHTGAVTLIQRFGSALNLNMHLHMIFVGGHALEHMEDSALLSATD
jgi:hypothetical protein